MRGIVWWDEKHKQCKLGHTSKNESRVCVNAAGEPTRPLDGGEFPPWVPNTAVKYPGEARGMFGAAMRQGADGRLEGVKCEPYNYTGRTVVSVEDYAKHVAFECEGL